MITAKRQLAADKHGLGRIDRGEHLSTGFTKKRQATYDKRDRRIIEKRIQKTETMLTNKANLKEVKAKAKQGKPIADSWLKEAGKLFVSNNRHPMIARMANEESIRTGDLKTQLRRRLIVQNTKELKDVNQRIEAMLKD